MGYVRTSSYFISRKVSWIPPSCSNLNFKIGFNNSAPFGFFCFYTLRSCRCLSPVDVRSLSCRTRSSCISTLLIESGHPILLAGAAFPNPGLHDRRPFLLSALCPHTAHHRPICSCPKVALTGRRRRHECRHLAPFMPSSFERAFSSP